MRISRIVAVVGTAVLAPLAMTVPAAQADEHFTGANTPSDPVATVQEPDAVHDTCVKPDGGDATTHYDTIAFTSQSSGPRRIVMTSPSLSEAGFVLYAYRNGRCVAADYQPDDASEASARLVDLDGVYFAKGDKVSIRVIVFSESGTTLPWKVDILQPGTANAAAVGKGKRYVALPYQIACGTHKTTVKATKKARKVKSVVFRAGGKKVGAANSLRPRQNIRLKGIPASATSIKAVVKLKGGGKVKVSRPYSVC